MGQLQRIREMFGAAPQKPLVVTPEAKKVHSLKRMTKADFEAIKQHARDHELVTHKWRNRGWAVLILANLLFTFSFWLDIQILKGALTASRFVGFHLIDLNSALQVILAHKHIIVNLFIGTATVFVLWAFAGTRPGPAAGLRGGLLTPCLVPLRLPDRSDLWYGGRRFAGAR